MRKPIPKFLILDEATSFIPSNIAIDIIKRIKDLGITIISVAHK